MAKDAKGHGSEARGGGVPGEVPVPGRKGAVGVPLSSMMPQRRSSFDTINAGRKSEGAQPMDEKRRGTFDVLDYLAGDGPRPAVFDAAAKANPDAAAAAKLAEGGAPGKNTAVPVHAGAAGRQDSGPTNPRYNRDAVNAAIASSNRSGRKIGGKEAAAIHRLLSGGH